MGTPKRLREVLIPLTLSPCVILGLWGALLYSSGCAAAAMAPRTPGVAVALNRFAPSASVGAEVPIAASVASRALRQRGLRFGTDGTPGGLFALMKHSHEFVAPTKAQPGDLVFFDLGGGRCGEHVGVVEGVDDSGRLSFREAREGEIRVSYLHTGRPAQRRDEDGRVLNTFLRPRRPGDPPAARYFAGDMLCAVGRVKGS